MKIQKTIPEAEMVLEFLRAEIVSPRFGQRYRDWLVEHGLQASTDILAMSPADQRQLLWAVRPGIFRSLPEDMFWKNVLVEAEDWSMIMYINQDDWKSFSAGTRLVQRGVEKLGQPHHEKLTQRVSEITAQLRTGDQLPKIILVAKPEYSKFVILEGHARATAYMASGIHHDRQIPAILGTSNKLSSWAWY